MFVMGTDAAWALRATACEEAGPVVPVLVLVGTVVVPFRTPVVVGAVDGSGSVGGATFVIDGVVAVVIVVLPAPVEIVEMLLDDPPLASDCEKIVPDALSVMIGVDVIGETDAIEPPALPTVGVDEYVSLAPIRSCGKPVDLASAIS